MASLAPTVRGFNVWEVVSALQKAIRRGDEIQTVAWTVELDQSGHSQWLWNRLLVITSEDVGLAWPEGPQVIRALYETWREFKAGNKKHRPERLMVVHAALLLCHAQKSRLVDEATCSVFGVTRPLVSQEQLDRYLAAYDDPQPLADRIPDYAFDMHTARGRRLGRGLEHFEQEAAKLENPAPIQQEMDYWDREKKHYEEQASAVQHRAKTPEQTAQMLF